MGKGWGSASRSVRQFTRASISGCGWSSQPILVIVVLLCAASGLRAVGSTVSHSYAMTIRQVTVPPEKLARVFSGETTVGGLAGLVGALAGGYIGIAVGVRMAITVVAFCAILVPLSVAVSPLRGAILPEPD